LDATNVSAPLATIITHIGIDHRKILGPTLRRIAREKAGIIKKDTPVISAPQQAQVFEVLKERAVHMHAPLYVLGRDFSCRLRATKREYTSFDFTRADRQLKDLRIRLKGSFQLENVSLALAAASVLAERGFLEKHKVRVQRALEQSHIEARFEIVRTKPLTVIDAAHNPSSFAALAQALEAYFPHKKIILIFGAAQDKEVKKMLTHIPFSHLIATSFCSPRALKPGEIKRRVPCKNVLLAPNVRSAWKQARALYNNNSLIVISGSLYFAAEAKRLVR